MSPTCLKILSMMIHFYCSVEPLRRMRRRHTMQRTALNSSKPEKTPVKTTMAFEMMIVTKRSLDQATELAASVPHH